ncbi:MAG: phosphoribosylformimino-5-aminoimidazole carboxamide ribotide isomerase [Lachnospiraceae bacterium]|nr:phosphoribosylformimino-5-aminoimidazole carboxamide ribotide isomerase [Lachnospiraceae bacterium]
MRLRPCIDIHNGRVKQIVGSSLKDEGSSAEENFVSDHDAGYYASVYRDRSLTGGHVIVLNAKGSEYYEASKKAAFSALSAFPGGMQYGGGINNENALEFLDAGASHVIVTSFVFRNGRFDHDNLRKLQRETGKERLVLDLSCRRKDDGSYYVTTDRWQKYTDFKITKENLQDLSGECDEFLIHAVDMEGKGAGIDRDLIRILSELDSVPVTYAGGIASLDDIETIIKTGKGKVNYTIGSALDLFGGSLGLDDIIKKEKGYEE